MKFFCYSFHLYRYPHRKWKRKQKTRVKALYRNIKNERFFTVFIGGLVIIVSKQHQSVLFYTKRLCIVSGRIKIVFRRNDYGYIII
ncbi:hypothetical protein CMV54_05320 [Escherichia coli]|nr:hypothetical protein [Escherichia coli]EFO3792638.1 hypothetical protein [Escherichia coli]RJK42774.1 hypothetical protein CMV65_05470 [Escherichia coli]RJK45538.1 hypothetical protein CMV54_05320 [Escherichia coli]